MSNIRGNTMNDLPKWKQKIIIWLAGDEGILLNMTIFGRDLNRDVAGVYLPAPGVKLTVEEASARGILVPTKNMINKR